MNNDLIGTTIKKKDFSRYGEIGILKGKYVCGIYNLGKISLKFYEITDNEYDTFDIWKDDEATFNKISKRTYTHEAFNNHWEFISHK